MSPSCRSYMVAWHVMRMVVGLPYSEPKLRVKWPGPRSVIRAFSRGRIALMARTSMNGLSPTSRNDYKPWYHPDLLRSQPSLPKHGACHQCRVLRSLVHGIEMDQGAFHSWHIPTAKKWYL